MRQWVWKDANPRMCPPTHYLQNQSIQILIFNPICWRMQSPAYTLFCPLSSSLMNLLSSTSHAQFRQFLNFFLKSKINLIRGNMKIATSINLYTPENKFKCFIMPREIHLSRSNTTCLLINYPASRATMQNCSDLFTQISMNCVYP